MTEKEREERIIYVEKAREDAKSLLATHPHLKDFSEFLSFFNEETERGAALAAAAFLDDQIANVIKAFLVENARPARLLEGVNAPLGTFAARVMMAHAMGLISDAEAGDCGLIRKIRNKFAHAIRVSFDDEAVSRLCFQLNFSAKPYDDVTVSARGAFSTAAVSLMLHFTNRPHYVSKKKLIWQDWPY